MHVTPTGQSIYYDGNEIVRYGRDIGRNETYAVCYHDGIPSHDEPAWAMDVDAVERISVSVDTILMADANHGLWAVDRRAFRDNVKAISGRSQCFASASDPYTRKVGEPREHLSGHLWIESGNQVDEGYHKRKNEA